LLLGHLIKLHPSGAGRARGFKRWLGSGVFILLEKRPRRRQCNRKEELDPRPMHFRAPKRCSRKQKGDANRSQGCCAQVEECNFALVASSTPGQPHDEGHSARNTGARTHDEFQAPQYLFDTDGSRI
jgi:hypothetical protein